jgi:hypothetical protein
MTPADDLQTMDILTLGMRADEARQRAGRDRAVTYTRVHIIKDQSAAEIPVPAPAAEVRIAETPENFEAALALVRQVRQAAGDRPLAAFSLATLADRARGGWGDLGAVLERLAAAGLHDVAEVPVDEIDDLPGVIQIARSNGIAVRRVTMTHPASHRGSDLIERVRKCHAIAAVTRFAPLPRLVPHDKPTTGYEDIRMVALSRLALSAATSPPVSIEVDWSLYGPKLAQVALTFGADHLDAVPATNDEALGRRRATIEEVERNIRAAGFEPREERPAV